MPEGLALATPGADAPIAVPGRNCWAVAHASRFAVLVDAQAYFDAFVETAVRARESILVVGWDIQSGTRLRPGPMPEGLPATLGPFLDALVQRRPGLRVWLLDWDFSLVFALERELLPVVQLGWRTHRRIHFRMDGEHPLGASQHQKLVVVDDAVAFCGGLDLTTERWDTPAHAPEDPARVGPGGRPYAPFHDVQCAVAGPAAAVLGRLARERWRRATGRALRPPSRGRDPWPPGLAPDLVDVPVAVARTEPAFDGRPEVREVERLFVDAIAAARRWLYVENQYFTAPVLADAMAARLAEPDGPEIVCVLPQTCSGWLEESTMGVLRTRVLARLRAADVHRRLRVVWPRVGDTRVNVHAKVLIVDDALLRIGSSNLSRRSMGLDVECDVAVEARGRAHVASAIAGIRARLLGEHLGAAPEAVAACTAATGSLCATLDRFGGGARTLVPLDDPGPLPVLPLLPDVPIADTERPVAHAPFFVQVIPDAELREPLVRTALRVLGWLVVLLGGAALWRWTGLGALVAPERLAAWAAPLRHAPWAPTAVLAGYVVAGLCMVPVTALLAATLLVFDPVEGIVYALGGSVASAAAAYLVGRVLWRDALLRLAGRHFPRIHRRFAHHGILSVAVVRMLPIAPFTVVNLVAGGLRVRFDHFLAGTLLGMLPGTTGIWALLRAVGA